MIDILSASVQWDKVGIVLGIIAALAVLFAVLILIVTKVCKITEDEKVVKILNISPAQTAEAAGIRAARALPNVLPAARRVWTTARSRPTKKRR